MANDANWIVEIKMIHDGSAYNAYRKSLMDRVSGPSHYLARYLNWSQLGVHVNDDGEPFTGPPETIETLVRLVKGPFSMHSAYHYRLRNLVTDEIIPMDIFHE